MANENWLAHNLALATIKSMQRHKRKPADFYATPADATQGFLNTNPPPAGCSLWEPACGRGHISRVLSANGYVVASTDLRRTGFGTPGVDFLKTLPAAKTPIHGIVSNPPFKLAAEFIRHALEDCQVDYLALLLKSNFWHTKNRLALKQKHPPTGEHPVTWRIAFLEKERGKSPLMDCTWFVWDRQATMLRADAIERPTVYPDISKLGIMVQLASLDEQLERLARG